jgi:hypothetical protein
VRDEQWQALDDSRPLVRITTPLGDIVERSLRALDSGHGNRDRNRYGSAAGQFGARYIARDSGVYEVHVADAQSPQQSNDIFLATDDAAGLMISASGEEFLTPALHDERLRRIAGATAGSYRHLREAGDLVERITNSVAVVQSWRRVALWNAPILLLALLLLACGEWWLRRQRRHLP